MNVLINFIKCYPCYLKEVCHVIGFTHLSKQYGIVEECGITFRIKINC